MSDRRNDPAGGAGKAEPCIHSVGLQCAVKPPVREASASFREDPLDHLKQILESIPFTPSQGVRMESPRHAMGVRVPPSNSSWGLTCTRIGARFKATDVGT
jgi:hypothetical protein